MLFRGTPIIVAILAGVVALGTVGLSEYVLNGAGTSSAVYGYGWGAVLWFAAVSLLLVATGVRWLENEPYPGWRRVQGWSTVAVGMVYLLLVLGGITHYAIQAGAWA